VLLLNNLPLLSEVNVPAYSLPLTFTKFLISPLVSVQLVISLTVSALVILNNLPSPGAVLVPA
ncbi:hypothetical protein, partial [Borreliella garinii]|uniref:hypothetical protein n=1 Tax=Borreliella garinii TaxID=29519 RepID=UPI001AF02976